jgi:hypothetical protein
LRVYGLTTSDREFAAVRLSGAVCLAGGLLCLSLKLFCQNYGRILVSILLSYFYRETRPGMSDQLGEDVQAETAQAWDSVRRVREPIAWVLLVCAAIAVLVSAWQLVGLPGAPVPAPVIPSPAGGPVPVPVTTFAIRASAVAPQFVGGGIFTLPVLSVILVAFAGGRTDRARQVVQAAVSILAVALGLGVLSWLGALGGHLRQSVWFIFDATDIAAVTAALVFTVAVLRSQALRPLTPQWIDSGEDDEDFDEDDEDFDEDDEDFDEDA